MKTKIAINGFGRIGRNVARAIYESNYDQYFELVAVNDTAPIHASAHLLKYDTVHGRFPGTVEVGSDHMIINGNRVCVTSNRNPAELPWGELGVDIVLACSGAFASKDKAVFDLQAGAKKTLISAPAGSDVKTVVYGVNHDIIQPSDTIISNASCTTNCLAPVAKILAENVGIRTGLMTTVHSFTNDQCLTDSYHEDLHRARAAGYSMIPTKTGAAKALGLVLPDLDGKLDGYAVRVPTINVSMVDLTIEIERKTTVKEVNAMMREAAEGSMKGVLGYNEEPLVSVDFNHDSHSAIFDATQTRLLGNLLKVIAWYDNEWGFSNRMLDTARVMAKGL